MIDSLVDGTVGPPSADRRQLSATAVVDRPVVAMCVGKDCRQRDEFAKIRDQLGVVCDVVELRCMGICSGPVVVTGAGSDTPQVYSKLRSKSQRRHVLEAVVEGRKPSKALRKRAVTGAKRRTTLRKLDRVLR